MTSAVPRYIIYRDSAGVLRWCLLADNNGADSSEEYVLCRKVISSVTVAAQTPLVKGVSP